MKRLCVVGGRQKPPSAIDAKPEWHHYQCGVIAAVDLESGEVSECVTYVSPPDVCADEDPSILFKAGTIREGRLHVVTPTEVLVYRMRDWTMEHRVSIPWFNDVHHVLPLEEDRLAVANTGLDMVVEITLDGRVLREWSALDQSPWERFSREVDYRKVVSTKPHGAHPNFVFSVDGELWVTRADKGDARCLTGPGRQLQVRNTAVIHDGLVRGQHVYFTSVDGYIIRVDVAAGKPDRIFDLNALTSDEMPLGWCRGIAFVDDDHVAIGFSRLRRTKWKQNLRWLKHKLGGAGAGLHPTRIAVYHLERGELCAEYDLEPAGLSAVFSVHAVDGATAWGAASADRP